ncbi:MAG: GNAT family N-acetyltransferase [Anaerotignum sp.]|jgi:N-acetylglutamate synthase-like GNAT family acetyltransferase|nr:GNAT family N-acetyltransferase [Anaerotignum sp.]
MQKRVYKKLREFPELTERAAQWFHEKWGIPVEEYRKSMKSAVKSPGGVPQWYVIEDDGRILAGAGVIENDFHERKDLAPNICALFVEQDVRGQGLARELLRQIRTDIGGLGVSDLYLVTDHTAFYEKCGWEFLTMVKEEDGALIRMYHAETLKK